MFANSSVIYVKNNLLICSYNFTQHSEHEGWRFSCYYCGLKSTTKQRLLSHIQNFHEGKKFICDLCDFKTIQADILNSCKKNNH